MRIQCPSCNGAGWLESIDIKGLQKENARLAEIEAAAKAFLHAREVHNGKLLRYVCCRATEQLPGERAEMNKASEELKAAEEELRKLVAP
jgi:hypothetical protein